LRRRRQHRLAAVEGGGLGGGLAGEQEADQPPGLAECRRGCGGARAGCRLGEGGKDGPRRDVADDELEGVAGVGGLGQGEGDVAAADAGLIGVAGVGCLEVCDDALAGRESRQLIRDGLDPGQGATLGSPEKKLASVSIRRRAARSPGIIGRLRWPGGLVLSRRSAARRKRRARCVRAPAGEQLTDVVHPGLGVHAHFLVVIEDAPDQRDLLLTLVFGHALADPALETEGFFDAHAVAQEATCRSRWVRRSQSLARAASTISVE
jgi:hypothetical protein